MYIVWRNYQRRAEVLAPLLEMPVHFLAHNYSSKWLRPLDYLGKIYRTYRLLKSHKSACLVLQAPPLFAALSAILARVPYIVDAHNAVFQSRWFKLPFTKVILSHAAAIIVHNEEIQQLATDLLSTATPILTIADPVPPICWPGKHQLREDKQIFFIGSFASDEPVDVLLEVIKAMPEYTFVITANPDHLNIDKRQKLFDLKNAELTGFLPTERYQQMLLESRAALVLTTRPATQPSGACEALAADTPLILSETTLTKALFSDWAQLSANTPEALTQAILSCPPPKDLSTYRRQWNRNVATALEDLKNMVTTLEDMNDRDIY